MIAITGAGEYLDTIRPYDKLLLDKLEIEPYVLSFPTAAGLESEERIQYWLNLADEHFEKLGVQHKSIKALNVNDYNKPETIAEIEKANFIYFSGGNPNHLYETLSNSLAWEKILSIHHDGGILAGCSAGAMIMGEKMIKGVGLNYVPNTIVIPHYGESYYSWISNTVKVLNRGKYKLLCLEKDTYFIKDGDQLSVLGKQNVHIIYKKEHHTFTDGDTIDTSLLQ